MGSVLTDSQNSCPFKCSDKLKGNTRNAIRFSDVDPPGMRKEIKSGSLVPSQLTAEHQVIQFADSADGKGYEMRRYDREDVGAFDSKVSDPVTIPAAAVPPVVRQYRNPGSAPDSGIMDVVTTALNPLDGTHDIHTLRITAPPGATTC